MRIFSREPKQLTHEPSPLEATDVGFMSREEIQKHKRALAVLRDIAEIADLTIEINERLDTYSTALTSASPDNEMVTKLLNKLMAAAYGKHADGNGVIESAAEVLTAYDQFKASLGQDAAFRDLMREMIAEEEQFGGASHYDALDTNLQIPALQTVREAEQDAQHADTIAAKSAALPWYEWLRKRAGGRAAEQQYAAALGNIETVQAGFAERRKERDLIAKQIEVWDGQTEARTIKGQLQNIDVISMAATTMIEIGAMNGLNLEQQTTLEQAFDDLSSIDPLGTDVKRVAKRCTEILQMVIIVVNPEHAKEKLETYLNTIEKKVKRTTAEIQTQMSGMDTIFATFGESVPKADMEQFKDIAARFQSAVTRLGEKVRALRAQVQETADPRALMGLERVFTGVEAQLTEEFDMVAAEMQTFVTTLSARVFGRTESSQGAMQLESQEVVRDLVFRAVYDPEARKSTHPHEMPLPNMEGTLERREFTIDMREVYERSITFYETQSLHTYANALREELPRGIELTEGQRKEIQEYMERGFDFPIVMPSLAALEAMRNGTEDIVRMQERVVDEVSTDRQMNYKKAWIGGEQGYPPPNPTLSAEARQLRERPHLHFFHKGAVPNGTKHLNSKAALKLTQVQGWTEFGYDEFAIAERMIAGERNDHRWGAYDGDKQKSNWTWALANRKMEGDTLARAGSVLWDPDAERLCAGWDDSAYRSASFGVRPSVALPL